MNKSNLLKALKYIPAADCDYQEWVNVGMALKHEGCPVSVWDEWSRADSRYHAGECERKWESFNGSTSPVTAGTIVNMAKAYGYRPTAITNYDWDDEINREAENEEGVKLADCDEWDPVDQITTMLSLLFKPNEYVGYVTETYENTRDGQTVYSPTRGAYDRTAGQLITALKSCNGDIGSVLGDANEKAGAWIRINPLDGKGVKDENVTDYRYVLIESDSLPIERQNALIRELELPVATLTHTGGKSLHAVVHIDAKDREEYRERVKFMFDICKKNGLEIDKSCKNPSRLSRLPGFMRGGNRQYLVDIDIGRESFEDWQEHIEEISDDLPDEVSYADIMDDLPPLAPPLIEGVLRQGHKMLIAGPSKAGKSFALMELAIAIAEGIDWLGFKCAKGKVWYINLELDQNSCWHRFKEIYTAMGIEPEHANDLFVSNLRGQSKPMDELVKSIVRRAKKGGYTAIIIDPIYKVITGDENSAEQMAHFCNQFDRICREAGCAVICCHHHSKGTQGGKRSMDRASGSGVFARDPDALLDLTELEVSDSLKKQQEDDAVCAVTCDWLRRWHIDMDEFSQDDLKSAKTMLDAAQRYLPPKSYALLLAAAADAKAGARRKRAWRVEATLREFPCFEPLDLWFDYPVHRADTVGVLKDLSPESENDWRKNFSKRKTNEERKKDRKDSLETAYSAGEVDGKCTIADIAEYLGVTEKTVRNRLKEHGNFWIEDGECGLKSR